MSEQDVERLRERYLELLDVGLEIECENARLREGLREYAQHAAWRCEYRSRYGACLCGLDDFMVGIGLEPVPVDDPEARAALNQGGPA